jgi:ParB/RepB/Spo0J family partition protein
MAKKPTSFFPPGPKVQPSPRPSATSSPPQESEQAAIERTIEQHVLMPQTMSFQDIPLDRIRPNPFQARTDFATPESDEDLRELAQAIREHGFISVLFVRPDPLEEGYFQLAYGERRWRAAHLVSSLTAIPCRIAAYTDEQMEDMGLIENMQRKALNPVDEALALQRKMGRIDPKTGKPYSIRGLADRLGVKKHRIEEPLRLCEIPQDVQAMVRKRPDTVRSAYELAKLPTPALRRQVIDMVLEREVNTREVMYLVNQLLEQQHAQQSNGQETFHSSTQEMTARATDSSERQGPHLPDPPEGGVSLSTGESLTRAHLPLDEETPATEASLHPDAHGQQVAAVQEAATASRSRVPLSGYPDTGGTNTVETLPAPSRPKASSNPLRPAVSFEQHLLEKRVKEDAKAVLSTIKRWSQWAEEGTYERALLHSHVLQWQRELHSLQQRLQAPDATEPHDRPSTEDL